MTNPRHPRWMTVTKYVALAASFALLSAQDECGSSNALVELRLANLRDDGVAVNACIVLENGTLTGPLMPEVLPPGHVQAHSSRVIRPGDKLRWIVGDDCSVPAPGAVDADISGDFARQTAVVYGSAALETEIFASDVLEELDPGRFYVRLFHGATGLGPIDTRQFACVFGFAAFIDTDLGELGFSPNNNDTVFSASVSLGQDSFETTLFLCDEVGGGIEVYQALYEFFAGTQVTFFLRGDSPPYEVTACDDAAPLGTRCTPL